jgi:endonuclease-8
MPEGPSLIILKEKIIGFKGKKILEADGYAKIDYDEIVNKKVTDIRTWGKHLFICLPKTNIEIHLRMFGSYTINEKKEKKINPKLHLQFAKGELNFYVTDVKLTPDLSVYDWKADVMSDDWDSAGAKKKLKAIPDTKICDVLLDQHIFSGVGNIIKNEVLWRVKLHPATLIKNISPAKLNALLKDVVIYSFEFLAQRQKGILSRNWHAYNRTECSRCKGPIVKEEMGKGKRATFYCPHCQPLTDG